MNHFKQHSKSYEQYEKETVEILYEFVDFLAFKKSMIQFKKIHAFDIANGKKGLNHEIDPKLKASEDFFWNMHNEKDGWSKKT